MQRAASANATCRVSRRGTLRLQTQRAESTDLTRQPTQLGVPTRSTWCANSLNLVCQLVKDNEPQICQEPTIVVKNTKSIWLSKENFVPLHPNM